MFYKLKLEVKLGSRFLTIMALIMQGMSKGRYFSALHSFM